MSSSEKLCRDSSPQPGTQNSCGMPGNVFANPFALNEPTASCSRNVYARSPTATHGEPVFLSAGRPGARIDETNKDTQSLTIPTSRFAGSLPIWNYASSQKELIRKIMWLKSRRIRSRRCISIISLYLRLSSVGRRASKQKYDNVLVFLRKLCVGSKKWRWSARWTILRAPQ